MPIIKRSLKTRPGILVVTNKKRNPNHLIGLSRTVERLEATLLRRGQLETQNATAKTVFCAKRTCALNTWHKKTHQFQVSEALFGRGRVCRCSRDPNGPTVARVAGFTVKKPSWTGLEPVSTVELFPDLVRML